MLDLHEITQDPNALIKNLTERGITNPDRLVEQLLQTNRSRKVAQQACEQLAKQLKQITQEIATHLHKRATQEVSHAKAQVASLKAKQQNALEELKANEASLREQLLALPNKLDGIVPIDTNVTTGLIVSVWGKPDSVSNLRPHWELAEQYQLIDFAQGSKITGSGFPVYHNKGAKLQRALINFFLDQASAVGYQEVQVPLLVNEKSAEGTGQLPDKEGLMYTLTDTNLYLIPTAEVPVTNLYSEVILPCKQLPIKHVAYTPCFRREAGSWGSHVRGLNRLHQFDKVELVEIHQAGTADLAAEAMWYYVSTLLRQLNIIHRVVLLPSRDTGHAAALTYDIEVWSPGQQKWLEVSSVSLFNSYQARRMRMRYKQNGHNHFCHTINGSALALPRVVAALLETHQRPDHIAIPAVLHPYTHFTKI